MGQQTNLALRNAKGETMNLKGKAGNNQTGFTYIEMMIALVLIPILAVMMGKILTIFPKQYEEIDRERTMTEQARSALAWMGRDIRGADRILPGAGEYSTSSSGTLVIDSGHDDAKLVVWAIKKDALLRLEFKDSGAKEESDRLVFTAKSANFLLNFDKEPPGTSQVGINLQLARMVMDKQRKVNIMGLFGIRKDMQ